MPNATDVLVIIGTYSAAVHLFGVNSHSGIASLGTSTAFGTNQEALLFVPDPLCNGEANLLAVKNNCACDEFKNGRSGPMCCTARGALVSARISEAGDITKVGEVEYAGVGPIHMGPIQDQIAIADYVGGTAHIYGPIDPSTGVLGDRAVSTTKLSNRSLMHMVTSDPLCKGRRLLAVDSDYPAVVVVDHQTGGLVRKVDMPDRIRRVNFHPSLPVAYIMYEEAGSIGVWSWPRCEAWLDDATTSPPAEVSRFSTMPADPPLPPGTKNKPTSLMLTSNGMYAYTCTRTAFFTPTSVATAQIGVFRVGDNGLAEPIQWVDTGGYNTRDCELSADESMLFAVDVVASKFLAYRTDPLTGMLTLLGSANVPNPTMIEQYKQPATCAEHHAARFRDHLGHHAAVVAKASAENPLATVAICVALAVVAVACCCAPANLRKTCANVLPDHWSGKSATTGRRVGSLMIPEQVGNPLL
jgi:6-phosphogluconolactonase (cycloisomerase 2 family)